MLSCWALRPSRSLFAALDMLLQDYIQPVDLFQDSISNVTKTKVEPFVQQLRTLDNADQRPLIGEIKLLSRRDVDSIAQKVKAIRGNHRQGTGR